MNLKQMQIDDIETHINHINRGNAMVEDNWGTYVNQPAWDALDHEYINNISPIDIHKNMNGLKPFLRDMYIATNKEIISSLEYQLRKLKDEDS
ncbi:anti-restriction nuclease [Escherichia phage vB_EcoM_ESCO47]|nr:anti-restriction nuclease [Escherichia phage vB_EcoM_ESCO47]